MWLFWKFRSKWHLETLCPRLCVFKTVVTINDIKKGEEITIIYRTSKLPFENEEEFQKYKQNETEFLKIEKPKINEAVRLVRTELLKPYFPQLCEIIGIQDNLKNTKSDNIIETVS